MTREDALLKLLALEPETRSRLIVVTGWLADETDATLTALVKAGKVTYRNGSHGATGERLYYPKRATQGDVDALPVAAGSGRGRVRNRRGGLVRENGAVAFGWPWGPRAAGSGEETL